MNECSPECQSLKDVVAGMDPMELELELEASGRFGDPAAVAQYLLAGDTAPLDEPLPEAPPEEEPPA